MNESLQRIFEQHFNCKAQYAVKCPGRVNLIGEHIDYSGYGVLPMAVQVATNILVSFRDSDEICFYNTNPQFKPAIHKLDEEWIGKATKWYHYFLCGWKGMTEYLKLTPYGINVLLDGTIPPSSGLSSSSSIVCASALSTVALYTNKAFDVIDKKKLAEICAKIENYIGVESGGMDQAIEVLAEAGYAMMINFGPLRYEPIRLPENAVFAVVHCGRTMCKSETSHYNQRVVECRIASQIIAKKNGINGWNKIRTLKEVADLLHLQPKAMVNVAKQVLPNNVYSRAMIQQILDISDDEFAKLCLSANTQNMSEFKLRQRAEHVYAEANRVFLFRDACKAGDITKMGQLMNESHMSCKDLYECSCNELDKTVEECMQKGAIGARLTGAGWGGCVVVLFQNRDPDIDVLFWTEPAAGIELFNL